MLQSGREMVPAPKLSLVIDKQFFPANFQDQQQIKKKKKKKKHVSIMNSVIHKTKSEQSVKNKTKTTVLRKYHGLRPRERGIIPSTEVK
jgi:hypothetical protein